MYDAQMLASKCNTAERSTNDLVAEARRFLLQKAVKNLRKDSGKNQGVNTHSLGEKLLL